MKNIKKDESGIAHLGLVVIVVALVAVVGFGVYRVVDINQGADDQVSVQQESEEDSQVADSSDKSVDQNFDGTDNVEDPDED